MRGNGLPAVARLPGDDASGIGKAIESALGLAYSAISRSCSCDRELSRHQVVRQVGVAFELRYEFLD